MDPICYPEAVERGNGYAGVNLLGLIPIIFHYIYISSERHVLNVSYCREIKLYNKLCSYYDHNLLVLNRYNISYTSLLYYGRFIYYPNSKINLDIRICSGDRLEKDKGKTCSVQTI